MLNLKQAAMLAFAGASLALCAAPSVYDAKLFTQIKSERGMSDSVRARYLADVKAAGVECVFLTVCDYFEEGETRRKFMNDLADHVKYFEANGLSVAVWINGFGYGNSREGTAARMLAGNPRLTSFDGRTNGAMCPTGSAIRRVLIDNVRDIARTGVRMILMDDDYIQSVRPGLCCVCSNHLALISKRLGRTVGAAEVRDAYAGRPNDIRRASLDVSGEISIELAHELRRTVDAVDPTIGMGICASYTHWDVEGVDMNALIAAFAGNNRRFFRISGAPYWSPKYEGADLDSTIEFVRQQSAWCRQMQNTTVFDENDPWPRQVSVVPAWKCELYDKATIADGVLGRHKYMLCYGADRSETGYLEAHIANRPDDALLKRLFAGTRSYGIRVIYPQRSLREAVLPSPNAGDGASDKETMVTFSHAKASTFLTRNGFPVKHEGRGPALVFGQAALGVTQADLEDGVITDREAAGVLSERGFNIAEERVKVLEMVGREVDYTNCRSAAFTREILAAAEKFAGKPLGVYIEASRAGVYSLIRYDQVRDEYVALLENLAAETVPVRIRTPWKCRIVGSLRGEFRAGETGVDLSALPAHQYAVVRFSPSEGKLR